MSRSRQGRYRELNQVFEEILRERELTLTDVAKHMKKKNAATLSALMQGNYLPSQRTAAAMVEAVNTLCFNREPLVEVGWVWDERYLCRREK